MSKSTIFSSLDSELRIRLAAKQMPFHKYKRLCEWLNCFQYIPPDNRILSSLIQRSKYNNASQAFKAWLWLDCVESTLTLSEQQCLARLINESETFLTLPS